MGWIVSSKNNEGAPLLASFEKWEHGRWQLSDLTKNREKWDTLIVSPVRVSEDESWATRQSALEILCLQNKLKKNCDNCREDIEQRIEQMRRYRDSFR